MRPQKKTVTFVVTEDCNFACSYCYLRHKNNRRRMPLRVATAAIDYLVERRDLFAEEEVIWEFIGGEPLLEAELIEEIIEHIQRKTYAESHPWFASSYFSISSNGSLYETDAAQRLVSRHAPRLEVAITLDGPRHVHDMARLSVDGRGTYDQVARNVPLWLEQYPRASTKVTIAHETLPHVADSILHLFSLGIRQVNANVVFEDVWHDGDDEVFEGQLDRLGQEMIARGLHPEHNCSLFNRSIGRPIPPGEGRNWCGAGLMLAIDAEGLLYPCLRFMAFSLRQRTPRTVGSLSAGLDANRVRPFLALTAASQSPKACHECDVATGCAWCQGFNYDDADTPTIYQRAVHICAMHKARVRANARFWARVGASNRDPDQHG